MGSQPQQKFQVSPDQILASCSNPHRSTGLGLYRVLFRFFRVSRILRIMEKKMEATNLGLECRGLWQPQ